MSTFAEKWKENEDREIKELNLCENDGKEDEDDVQRYYSLKKSAVEFTSRIASHSGNKVKSSNNQPCEQNMNSVQYCGMLFS